MTNAQKGVNKSYHFSPHLQEKIPFNNHDDSLCHVRFGQLLEGSMDTSLMWRLPHKIVAISYDGANGSLRTKSPEFLTKNPNGQTPLLELDDGHFLAESNAILLYLAERYQKMMPPPNLTNWYRRGQIYQWLFFEQYSHEPYIAVRRANIIFQRPTTAEAMQKLLEKGNSALEVMEVQLKKTSSYIAGGSEPSVADIALYAYTAWLRREGTILLNIPLSSLGWLVTRLYHILKTWKSCEK